jgi:hypothetical protein
MLWYFFLNHPPFAQSLKDEPKKGLEVTVPETVVLVAIKPTTFARCL